MSGSDGHGTKRPPRRAYVPYAYLEEERDYRSFPMAPQSPPTDGTETIDPGVIERVDRLARENLVISLHDHASVRPSDPSDFEAYREQGREWTPYAGLAASPLDIVFDGGLAAVGRRWKTRPWNWEDTVADLGTRQADWAHSGMIRAVRGLGDLRKRGVSEPVGIVLTLESASPIGRDIDRLDVLYGLGIRSLGVTYSDRNRLGGGGNDAVDEGLTAFGARAVRRMNQLGILVDVSHAGDRTSLETIATSTKPVVITHAGARAVWSTPRMKPDDVIRACAARGGVIGIEAAPGSTLAGDPSRHDLDAVFAHVHHCLDLVGIDHVTFGPDTHFGDHVAWSRHFGSPGMAAELGRLRVPRVIGCEDPITAWRNILRRLVTDGFSDDEIRRLIGGNVVRVLREVWPA